MKKFFGLLGTFCLSIPPLMGVVACDDNTSPVIPPGPTPDFPLTINSADLKKDIDANGNVIYIKSDWYAIDGSDGGPISTSDEIETKFTRWFDHQINSRLWKGNATVDVDYTVDVLGGGDFSDSGTKSADDTNSIPAQWSYLYVKELEITPIADSVYFKGDPIDFFFVVAPSLAFVRFYADPSVPSADKDKVPYTLLKSVKVSANGDYHVLGKESHMMINVTDINSKEEFDKWFFDIFTHNLIGWDIETVEKNTSITADYDFSKHVSDSDVIFKVSYSNIDHLWFDSEGVSAAYAVIWDHSSFTVN